VTDEDEDSFYFDPMAWVRREIVATIVPVMCSHCGHIQAAPGMPSIGPQLAQDARRKKKRVRTVAGSPKRNRTRL
jgi:hypothetical protein